jgi:hypothetical protein
VDFYLSALEEQGDAQKRGQAARNRRLAYMQRLEKGGAFFSEREMRERQPALHHQYIGQYRPPEAPQGALPLGRPPPSAPPRCMAVATGCSLQGAALGGRTAQGA